MVASRSRTVCLVAAAVALASSVHAFADTYPILAHSSIPIAALDRLRPSHPSHQVNVFRASTQKQHPWDGSVHEYDATTGESDLCLASTMLVYHVPSLHASDLAALSLPSSNTLRVPYVPARSRSTADKLVKEFVKECSATVQADGMANVWAGEESKTVRVEQVDGLAEWSLTARRGKEQRRKIMAQLEERIAMQLATVQGPFVVIVTTLPASSARTLIPATVTAPLVKRQYDVALADGFIDDGPQGELPVASVMVQGPDDPEETKPAKSIFEVDPKAGLLHRYVFFTSPLIFALGVSSIILIPVLVFTSQMLTSTETVAGLEAKMTGTVGLDPAKA